MTYSHLIQCACCGAEFRSAFSGAALAVGCQEACPSCGNAVATPLLSGDLNFDLVKNRFQEPILRDYGEDGYVFMGGGDLFSRISTPSIRAVHIAYDRNLHRALELLEIFEIVGVERRQLILSTVVLGTMTAYECLVGDLLLALKDFGVSGIRKLRGRPTFGERRDAVLEALSCPIDNPHVVALRYLYEIRNCLTHKAGIVDDEFILRVQKIGNFPRLTDRGPGEPLILEKGTATSFLDSLQQLASALLIRAERIADSSRIKGRP